MTLLPSGLSYVEVAAGGYHTLARRSDGSVVAWGENGSGQCNVPALAGRTLLRRGRRGLAPQRGAAQRWLGRGLGQQCLRPVQRASVAERARLRRGRRRAASTRWPGAATARSWRGETTSTASAMCRRCRRDSRTSKSTRASSTRWRGAATARSSPGAATYAVPELPAGSTYVDVDAGGSISVARYAAPCAPTSYCTAGTSASGCQALLSATGTASASAASGFTLQASGVEGAKDGLFFWGTNGRQANSWGNGTSFQCVAPPVKRGGMLAGVGSAGACNGSFAQDLNALWCPTCPKPAANPGRGGHRGRAALVPRPAEHLEQADELLGCDRVLRRSLEPGPAHGFGCTAAGRSLGCRGAWNAPAPPRPTRTNPCAR